MKEESNFVGVLHDERIALLKKLDAVDELIAVYAGEQEPPRAPKEKSVKAKKSTAKASGDGRKKPRKCKACGKAGHRSNNCPNVGVREGKDDNEPEVAEKLRCVACHDEDHVSKDCPDLDEIIAGLKADGNDSLKIAAKLRLSLKQVNEHWPKGGSDDEEV